MDGRTDRQTDTRPLLQTAAGCLVHIPRHHSAAKRRAHRGRLRPASCTPDRRDQQRRCGQQLPALCQLVPLTMSGYSNGVDRPHRSRLRPTSCTTDRRDQRYSQEDSSDAAYGYQLWVNESMTMSGYSNGGDRPHRVRPTDAAKWTSASTITACRVRLALAATELLLYSNYFTLRGQS